MTATLATLVDDDTRTRCGGGLCPTCRFCADHGVTPHLCITRGDTVDGTCLLWIIGGGYPAADVGRLATELRAHPAQPMLMAATGAGLGMLRAVHGSWCACQCSPDPATAPPGGARS